MLRLFALVMLLANAGYFAWSQGHLRALGWGPVEQREPERLAQQLGADKLRLLSAPVNNNGTSNGADATSGGPPSTVETAATSAAPTPSAPADAPASEPTQCRQVAGLSAEQAATLQSNLVDAGLDKRRWSLEESVLPERWIVYIGKFPSADLMSRKKTELRSLKVDFREVSAPALQPGLALGTYSTEAAAQTALQDLGRVGVRSAKVTREREEQRSQTLRLPALTSAERSTVAPLLASMENKTWVACP